MRRIMCIVLLLVVLVIATGFYRGWFSISTTRDTEIGQTEVHLGIADGKIHSDVLQVKDWIAGVFTQGKEPSEPLR